MSTSMLSDPWMVLSVVAMALLCAILGYGARHVIALDRRFRAMPGYGRGFSSRGLFLEAIKGLYALLVFACFAGYIALLRYRFGFTGAKYYVDAFACGTFLGIPVAAWAMGFFKPMSLWEGLKRHLAKKSRVQ